ncbi:MAG: hypothetical protein KJZ95_17285 [Caldilinea sp.]|nr:hypothetical protein [Caldilinea sp.]
MTWTASSLLFDDAAIVHERARSWGALQSWECAMQVIASGVVWRHVMLEAMTCFSQT